MKRFKALAAAAAASAAVLLSGCTNYEKLMQEAPADYITEACENSFKAVLTKDPLGIAKTVNDSLNGGSVRIEVSDKETSHTVITNQNIKPKKEYAMAYTISSGGEKYTTSAGLNEDRMYFTSSGDSGKYSYYIDRASFSKDFEDSIFYYTSGSSYAFDKETCETIEKLVEDYSDKSSSGSKDAEKIKKLLNKTKHTYSSEKTSIGDKEVKAHIISYDLDGDDVYDLLDEMADIVSDMELDLDSLADISSDDVADVFRELGDYFREGDGSLKMNWYINSMSHAVMMMDFKVSFSDGYEKITASGEVSLGADPAKSKEYSFKIKLSDGSSDYTVSAAVNDESTKDTVRYSSVVKLKDRYDNIEAKASLEFDRKSKEYVLDVRFPYDGEETAKCKFSGTISSAKSDVEITVDSVSFSFLDEKPKIKVTVVYSAKPADIPDDSGAKKFFSISEDEFDEMAESMGNDITGVLEASDSAAGEYVNSSRISQYNANAKQVYTAVASGMTLMCIQGEQPDYTDVFWVTVPPASGSGSGAYIDCSVSGYDLDLISYLGENFKGYGYALCDPYTYGVKYVLYSDKPIPDSYLRQYTDEEIKKVNNEIHMGCYPLAY